MSEFKTTDLTQVVDLKRSIRHAVKEVMECAGLWVGQVVFVKRIGCYKCGRETSCEGCGKNTINYIEPMKIADINITFIEGRMAVSIACYDVEGDMENYDVSKLGQIFFTSREDAVNNLVKTSENGG